jgi:hypothetical protein
VKTNLQRLSERIIMAISTYPPAIPPSVLNRLGDGNDTLRVKMTDDGKYAITVNGQTQEYSAEQLQELGYMDDEGTLHLDTGDGDDFVDIDENVTTKVVLKLGKGNDSAWGGSGDDNISGGDGNDKIYGRGGDDTMDGGAGDDEIWGLKGHNTMIGGSGKDKFVTSAVSQALMDFATGEDTLPNATTAPSNAPVATPTNPTASTPAAGPTEPATTAAPAGSAAPASTTTPAAVGTTSAGGNGSIVINGNGNNTIYAGSAPAGAAAAAGTTTSGNNISLATVMAGPAFTNYKQTSPGEYTYVKSGETITMTQPGGPGSQIVQTTTTTSGPNKGAVLVNKVDADGNNPVFGSYNNPNFTAAENKVINDAMKSKGGKFDGEYLADQLDMANGGHTKKKEKKGSHGTSNTTSGASGGDSAAGGSSDVGGSGDSGGLGDSGAVEGTNLNSAGLDIGGSDGSGSWFMVLAEGLGTIMNKFAQKMIGLLNEIKNAGDDPPYKLTADFQATSQQLSFMQQAFMTALNALGESIKTSVTAGGAAR